MIHRARRIRLSCVVCCVCALRIGWAGGEGRGSPIWLRKVGARRGGSARQGGVYSFFQWSPFRLTCVLAQFPSTPGGMNKTTRIMHVYVPATIPTRPHYDPRTTTIHPRYGTCKVPIRSRYGPDMVPIRSRYNPGMVRIHSRDGPGAIST